MESVLRRSLCWLQLEVRGELTEVDGAVHTDTFQMDTASMAPLPGQCKGASSIVGHILSCLPDGSNGEAR